MDLRSGALGRQPGDRLSPESGAGLPLEPGAGLRGVCMHTGTLTLTGGWSRELERCTTALPLAESLRLNVDAERGI